MTERQAPYGLTAVCLHCGVAYTPRKAGHVFCSAFCRHRGERLPDQREPVDHEQIRRLFDTERDPDERVRPDDWHATPQVPEFVELDRWDTLRQRRHWHEELRAMGRL